MLDEIMVTAAQMQAIETRLFDGGIPVAALMEKVGQLITQWLLASDLLPPTGQVGVLVGPGHNGGDALVVARELHLRGYRVQCCQPMAKLKPLTQAHRDFANHLDIPVWTTLAELGEVDLWIDGLFGFGLTRPLQSPSLELVAQVNNSGIPVVSIDVPSGLHTDTGEVLGDAIRATHTLCLGLWKRGFGVEEARPWLGAATRLEFGIPVADVQAVLGESHGLQRVTLSNIRNWLPRITVPTVHKYQRGSLLLVAGSRQYAGAAILCALGAKASGVGMLTVAVPASIHGLLVARLPDAVILACSETDEGILAELPSNLNLDRYDVIALGPGLTQQADALVDQLLTVTLPLILDADGLNCLAQLKVGDRLQQRSAPTILTPHLGEFKRLFPDLLATCPDRIMATQTAAQQTGAWIVLKGASTAIASPSGPTWINTESSPALARGGSGDVLTGLMGGLLAQHHRQAIDQGATGLAMESGGAMVEDRPLAIAATAVWWHAQAGLRGAIARTAIGVDALTLAEALIPALGSF
jgi:NAD(P)H-hydrate epimerase